MFKPAVLVRDPDFIKDLLITNFNSFSDNDSYLSKKNDPLVATNPFFVEGDEWRESRKTILPAFSQSKVILNILCYDLIEYEDSFINFILDKKYNASNGRRCYRFR